MPQAAPAPRVFDLGLPALELEAGARVSHHVVRGWWWGPEGDLPSLRGRARILSEAEVERDAYRVQRRTLAQLDAIPRAAADAPKPATEVPTILLVHALTGDMRAGGEGGWWEPLIGEGRLFDPTRHRLLCFNNLGSCYGTVGPADEGFPTNADEPHPGPLPRDPTDDDPRLPATITTWDQARSILLALDALGVDKVSLVTGGSLGGMISLCLAVLAPERFERLAPIAATEAAGAWIIGWNHIARQAIRLDPGFPEDPSRGLELARQLATLTYRAEPGLDERQGRGQWVDEGRWSARAAYRMGTYLEHQGVKLRERFHGGSYLAQLGAMDHHDLNRRPGGAPEGVWGLSRVRSSAMLVWIVSDQLFFPEQMRRIAAKLKEQGRSCEVASVTSSHGHDAFLIEWDQLESALRRALALPPGR